jgi:hypothetical protein
MLPFDMSNCISKSMRMNIKQIYLILVTFILKSEEEWRKKSMTLSTMIKTNSKKYDL